MIALLVNPRAGSRVRYSVRVFWTREYLIDGVPVERLQLARLIVNIAGENAPLPANVVVVTVIS